MISVIIPYYNPDQNIATEKLLKRAIRSACDSLDGVATYEILIVNDGSHGDPVLDEFEDKPLIYIRREHNMLGAARNTGIDNASGNLLTFLDADDFYYPGALALCIRKMEESGADLLGFGIKPTSCGSDICNIKSGTPSFLEPMTGNEYMRRYNLFGSACRYLISASLIKEHGLRFMENSYIEDEEFTPRMMFYSRRYIHTDFPVYAYYIRDGSIITSDSPEKREQKSRDTLKALRHLIAFRDEHLAESHDGLNRKISYLAMDHLRRTLRRDDWREAAAKQIENLSALGAFPLRDNGYSLKFKLFSRLSTSRAGLLLLHIAEKRYK